MRDFSKFIAVASLILLLLVSASISGSAESKEKTRADVLAEIEKIEPGFRKNPNDKDTRLTYAKLLYQSGEFWKAREVLTPLLEEPEPSAEVLSLGAELEYLHGRYDAAEELYTRLIAARKADVRGQVMAKVGLMMTYYQMNQYAKAREIDFPPGVVLPNWELMKSFEESPYQMKKRKHSRMVKISEFNRYISLLIYLCQGGFELPEESLRSISF